MNGLIKDVVEGYLKGKDGVRSIAGLYGDASYRRYFRIGLDSGKTLIVMKMPEGKASASEEITNYEGPKGELPYINISRYLDSIGVSVPKVLHYNREHAAIILQDLGDHLLLKDVENAAEAVKMDRYKEAIGLLVSIQKRAKANDTCIAFKRSFDAALLNWEFDHFMEYGIEARTGRKPAANIKERFTEITRSITKELLKMEYIFTHRDYQSRNIIIDNGSLYLLDFQDALLGPRSYDLVALTRDSYVEISDGLLEDLVSYYCDLSGTDLKTFRREFDLVTIQRKLKDAGRFVYIDRVKGNPGYLTHIPRSLSYVKKVLSKWTEYSDLLDILKDYVEEWIDV